MSLSPRAGIELTGGAHPAQVLLRHRLAPCVPPSQLYCRGRSPISPFGIVGTRSLCRLHIECARSGKEFRSYCERLVSTCFPCSLHVECAPVVSCAWPPGGVELWARECALFGCKKCTRDGSRFCVRNGGKSGSRNGARQGGCECTPAGPKGGSTGSTHCIYRRYWVGGLSAGLRAGLPSPTVPHPR
jgi:hypothetical protein